MYSSTQTDSVIISLDAQQAFDQVEWGNMFNVLKIFGLGTKMLSHKNALLSSQGLMY